MAITGVTAVPSVAAAPFSASVVRAWPPCAVMDRLCAPKIAAESGTDASVVSMTIDRPIDRPSPNASPEAPAAVPGSAFTVDTDFDPAARVRSPVPPAKVSTEESPTEAVAEISTRLNASEPATEFFPPPAPEVASAPNTCASSAAVAGSPSASRTFVPASTDNDLPNSCAPAPRPALVVANAKFKPTAAPTVSPVEAPVVTA